MGRSRLSCKSRQKVFAPRKDFNRFCSTKVLHSFFLCVAWWSLWFHYLCLLLQMAEVLPKRIVPQRSRGSGENRNAVALPSQRLCKIQLSYGAACEGLVLKFW